MKIYIKLLLKFHAGDKCEIYYQNTSEFGCLITTGKI